MNDELSCWTQRLSAARIAASVREAGERISSDYSGSARELILAGLLEGGVVFLADLARAVRLPVRIATMHTRSYGAATRSSGQVELAADLELDIAGKDVIVVDDIHDSGRTLAFVERRLRPRRPRSLEFACLLVKNVPRAEAVNVRYGLFPVPNRFVVGYGLDLAGWGRGLPDIWALNEGCSEQAALEQLRSKAFRGFEAESVQAE